MQLYLFSNAYVEYQSDTISKQEQQSIYKEVKGLTKELKNIFESATFNGEKIFAKNNKEGIQSKLQLDMPDMSFLDDLKGKLEVGEIANTISNPLEQSLTNIQQLKTTTSYNTAIEAYKKSMGTQTETSTNTQSLTTMSTTGATYAEGFISDLVSKTLKDVFSDNEEVIDYLTSNSPLEIYKELKEQSYESLQSLAEEYGLEEEFGFLDKLGVFDLIGIPKEPTSPPVEPVEPTNPGDGIEPPDEPDITPPTTDEGNTEVDEEAGDDSTGEITNPTNPTTPGSTDNESEVEDDVNNGDGSIDIDIDIDIDIENPVGGIVDEATDAIEESLDDTEDITDDILDEVGEWLNPDYVEETILDVIGSVQADVEIKNRILEFRERYEERIQEIQEERLARLQEVDTAKELIEKSKLTLLKEINSYLLHWNLAHQQRMIDLMF